MNKTTENFNSNPYFVFQKTLKWVVSEKKYLEKTLETLESFAKDKCTKDYIYSHPSIKFFSVSTDKKSDGESYNDYSLNPWEQLRQEFLHSLSLSKNEMIYKLEKAVSWFDTIQRPQDWLTS